MMVSQNGERWKQQPSRDLTERTRADAAKLRDVLSRSRAADGTVRQRFADLKGARTDR